MSFTEQLKKDFSTLTLVLIPVAIAINIVIGQIVVLLKLPVFLDSIGTVLVAVLAGPWAGALTGALSNIIWGLLVDPGAVPWFPVAAAIGLVAGICANFGLFKSWWKVFIAGFFVALAAVIVSTPIGVYLFGGITSSGSSFTRNTSDLIICSGSTAKARAASGTVGVCSFSGKMVASISCASMKRCRSALVSGD